MTQCGPSRTLKMFLFVFDAQKASESYLIVQEPNYQTVQKKRIGDHNRFIWDKMDYKQRVL